MIRRGGTFVAGLLTGLLAAGLVILLTSPDRGQPILLLPAPTPHPIRVHVSGSVVEPGVYAMAQGAIVQDALRAAGGATGETALQAVNLAQTIHDGERLYFPSQSELATTGATAFPAVVDAADSATGDRIDLNQATAPELEMLPGIGPSLAQKIVDFREQQGPFGSVEDLMDVPGIGPAKLEAVKELIFVR
jgi:competence protein ComEA